MKVNLATNSATGQGNDTLVNIENVVGSNLVDTLQGNAGNNTLNGAAGQANRDRSNKSEQRIVSPKYHRDTGSKPKHARDRDIELANHDGQA